MKTIIKLLFPFALLIGCQSADAPVLNLVQRFEPGATRVHYADVAATTTPAAFRVEIVLPEGFKTQQAGQSAATSGDIQAFRLFLVRSASLPGAGSVMPDGGPYTMPVNLSGGKQSLTFRNVSPGSYYVCAAAFDSSSSFTPLSNLSHQSLGHSYGEGRCALSTGGGIANTGRVEVNADFSVVGTPQLQVALPLRDASGAGIQTRVEVYLKP